MSNKSRGLLAGIFFGFEKAFLESDAFSNYLFVA